jgi:hypothetical protein
MNCLTTRRGCSTFDMAMMTPRLAFGLGFLAVIVRNVGEQQAPAVRGMRDTIGMAQARVAPSAVTDEGGCKNEACTTTPAGASLLPRSVTEGRVSAFR